MILMWISDSVMLAEHMASSIRRSTCKYKNCVHLIQSFAGLLFFREIPWFCWKFFEKRCSILHQLSLDSPTVRFENWNENCPLVQCTHSECLKLHFKNRPPPTTLLVVKKNENHKLKEKKNNEYWKMPFK